MGSNTACFRRDKSAAVLWNGTNKCGDTCHVALDEMSVLPLPTINRLIQIALPIFHWFAFVWVGWIHAKTPRESRLGKVFQIKTVGVTLNDLKPWKSLLVSASLLRTQVRFTAWICCLTLSFLPWNELSGDSRLRCSWAFGVWINTAKVRLQKFFVQWSHHWRCCFLFCFSV